MYHSSKTTIVVLLTLLVGSGSAQQSASKKQVDVRSLGKDIAVIGRLGKPLGTMISVEGTWGFPDQSAGPTKDYSVQFTIHTANGANLKTPVTLSYRSVQIEDKHGKSLIPPHKHHKELDGQSWKLRVFETARFTRIPLEYWNHRGGAVTMPYTPPFDSVIRGFMQRNTENTPEQGRRITK